MKIFFLILSQLFILAINCVHASNWFTHLLPTRQTAGHSSLLHPSHRFLSTWGAVSLEKKKQKFTVQSLKKL